MATEYGARLRAARKHAGLTQVEASKKTGIPQSTISTAEREGQGSADTPVYAKAYGVDAHWLATGDGDMLQVTATRVKLSGVTLEELTNVSEIKKRAIVPLISWVQAGEFSEVLDIFHPGEAVQWEEAYFSSPSKRAYALLVEGDSMDRGSGSPNFPAGTILIVDPDRASHAGDYVIAKDVATQRATFKQLVTDGARWYLRPLNPVYPTIEIDDPALRVIGRVIEFKPPGGKL